MFIPLLLLSVQASPLRYLTKSRLGAYPCTPRMHIPAHVWMQFILLASDVDWPRLDDRAGGREVALRGVEGEGDTGFSCKVRASHWRKEQRIFLLDFLNFNTLSCVTFSQKIQISEDANLASRDWMGLLAPSASRLQRLRVCRVSRAGKTLRCRTASSTSRCHFYNTP
jgi:hypothetical protein